MQVKEVLASDLFNAGRWGVEIFTTEEAGQIIGKWPHVRIGEIAEESTLSANPQDQDLGGFYYVGLENVESITGDPVDLTRRGRNEIKSRSKIYTGECVLFGRLRPYLRKVFVAEGEYSEGLCSTEFIVLKPSTEKILPHVFRALLASESMAKRLGGLQVGVSLPRVSSRDLLCATIPLPPVSVQHEMARRLIMLREERLRLKERLRRMPQELDRIVLDLGIKQEESHRGNQILRD